MLPLELTSLLNKPLSALKLEPLFDLLYDRVEERHTTAYGIESIGHEEYRQVVMQ